MGHRQLLALSSILVTAVTAAVSTIVQKLGDNPTSVNWTVVALPALLSGLSALMVGINALYAPVPETTSPGLIRPPAVDPVPPPPHV